MTSVRTILVAIADPAAREQPAVKRAAQIASPTNARVVLFHAAYESYLSGRPFFDTARLGKSRGAFVETRTRQLERHATALRKHGIAVETNVVWEEPPHEAIVRAAIRHDAGLVVAGVHREGTSRSLRYTDWELLRLCPRPLLIVRAQRSRGPVVAALDPTHMFDKPAALDIALAQQGAALAAALGASFDAVHCLLPAAYPLGVPTEKERRQMGEEAQTSLLDTLTKSGVEARKIHVVPGLPEAAIPKLLTKVGAQVLVIGAISRRGLKRLVIGNTAEKLIHSTPCDLLIVKPKGFKAPLGRVRKAEVVTPARGKPARR